MQQDPPPQQRLPSVLHSTLQHSALQQRLVSTACLNTPGSCTEDIYFSIKCYLNIDINTLPSYINN